MKKLVFACMILVMLCFIGCDQAEQQNPSTEPTTCAHKNLGGGGVRYEYGECCEDPMDVYVKCLDCGEYVFSATIPSDKKCWSSGGKLQTVREPSCTEEGMGTWECSMCHTVYEVPIEMVEHEFMWFWGDDAPSCVDCGYALDACVHEYEKVGERTYSKDFAGSTGLKCKHCGDTKREYFDQYGEFDLEQVAEELRSLATWYGFQVVLGYAPTPHSPVIRKQEGLVYRNTNSKEAGQRLLDMGENLLDYIMETHFPPNNNPSEYYLWMDVTYSDSSITSGFNVTITFAPTDMDFE